METQIKELKMKRFPADIIAFMLIALFANAFLQNAEAATCTSISRSTFGSGTVLTSSELNTQFNTVYNAANALDAGCLTVGTLESDALNTADFQPVLNSIQSGCKVSFSSATEVSISKCSASIGDNFLNKTTATVAAFGCTDCSAEAASTAFYVYIKTGSTGTTLTPLILTGAPNADGYDGSGNKVIGRFFNDNASNINTYSIDQWAVNKFVPQDTGKIGEAAIALDAVTTAPTSMTFTANLTYAVRDNSHSYVNINFAENNFSAGAGSGDYIFPLPVGVEFPETTFNTGANPHNKATEMYGPVYIQMLVTTTLHTGTGYIVPYDKDNYRVWIAVAVDDSPAISNPNEFLSNSSFTVGRYLTVKGSFKFLNNNWNY